MVAAAARLRRGRPRHMARAVKAATAVHKQQEKECQRAKRSGERCEPIRHALPA